MKNMTIAVLCIILLFGCIQRILQQYSECTMDSNCITKAIEMCQPAHYKIVKNETEYTIDVWGKENSKCSLSARWSYLEFGKGNHGWLCDVEFDELMQFDKLIKKEIDNNDPRAYSLPSSSCYMID